MIEGRINLYSDTQSRPTAGMRQAMFDASVGDEQKGLDESVNQLCTFVAKLLGMEAAVFLPSGTMCNEIAILVHCKPGDEVYADKSSHLLNFEAGGPAALAGVNICPLRGENGIYTSQTLSEAIRKESRYGPRSRLVSVEQTANLGGGRIWPIESIQSVVDIAKSNDLRLHLDGARLMNAVVAADVSAARYCQGFDSAWVDLSKGLGCPVGAVLAGSQTFIDEVWRWKQRLGGAMRQAGFLAAAGLYAFQHHIEQLSIDHANARRLAEIIGTHNYVNLNPDDVETNIVLIDISETGVSAYELVSALEKRGINIGAFSDTLLRAVTYLDIGEEQIEEAGKEILTAVTDLM
ncbi:MAG: low specificity L-threonine aldolase [Chloroflexi bacterium]|nr:low specificity L-threonine aldolase [Chloroflexota bacterium]